MDGRSPYARYSNNWLIAREMLKRQLKSRQKLGGGKENHTYYGGMPYWMNQRQRTVETYDANQFLMVNKLEISPSIFQTEPSKIKKTNFRIGTNKGLMRQTPQSEPNIGAGKKRREMNRLKSFKEVSLSGVVSSRNVKLKQINAPSKSVSKPQPPLIQEKPLLLDDDEIYLPAPRIIYETFGPSN
jgi:hypothetical protein